MVQHAAAHPGTSPLCTVLATSLSVVLLFCVCGRLSPVTAPRTGTARGGASGTAFFYLNESIVNITSLTMPD